MTTIVFFPAPAMEISQIYVYQARVCFVAALKIITQAPLNFFNMNSLLTYAEIHSHNQGYIQA